MGERSYRAALYSFCVFLAAGASCSFEYSCGGVNTNEVERKIEAHIAEKLGGLEVDVQCPKLEKNATVQCTATPEDGEAFNVEVVVDGKRWDATPQTVVLGSMVEKLITDTYAGRGVETTADCGARVRPSNPGKLFTCTATVADSGEEKTVYVRIGDVEGNVEISERPFGVPTTTETSAGDTPDDDAPTEVVTESYRLPVPAGFEVVDEARVAEIEKRRQATIEQVLFRAESRTAIALQRLTGDVDPIDLESCRPLAAEEAAKVNMPVPEVTPYELGSRTTCRWEFEDPDEIASSTVVWAGSALYKIGCSMAKPVDAARAACDEVVHGFSAPPAAD